MSIIAVRESLIKRLKDNPLSDDPYIFVIETQKDNVSIHKFVDWDYTAFLIHELINAKANITKIRFLYERTIT